MAKIRTTTGNTDKKNDLESRLRRLQSTETNKTIQILDSQCGKNALPIAELKKILDRELGEKTLTGELSKMREEP
jgi:hypothetical protein